MLNLNAIQIKKPMADGNYDATIKSYEVGDKLFITYTVDGQDYKQDYDEEAITPEDKRVWSPVKVVLEKMATWYYIPDNIQMIEYMIANKVVVKVTLSNNRNIKLLENKPAPAAPATPVPPVTAVKRRGVSAKTE